MGRYKVIRELGRNQEGGRITYLAADTSLDPPQQVVIKEFRFAASGANWSGFKAYEREIEVLRGLNHPRIPRYLDSLETKSGFCLVQEYKNALSLAVRRSFTPEEIKKIAVSALEILVYLQKRTPPVIHRDIKPENIVVDKQLNAYLVDFGFARIRGQELALSSVAAGTPGFMPPEEQFGRNLTEASDLYSLGATLICLLTGTRSVDVGNLIDDNYRFDFKKLVPKFNPRFISWLEKMVAPNVKQRHANAADALQVLKPIPVVGGVTGLESLVSAVKPRTSATGVGLATLGIFALFTLINLIDFQRENPVKIENSTPRFSPVGNENSTPRLSPVGTEQSSLVGYWNFDQCSSKGKPMLANELGSQIQGTMLQGVTCEQGRFGYAGFFDGVDDLIEIPDQPSFHFTNQMTVAAWVKPLRVSGLQTIVNKWYAMDSYMLLIENGNFVFTVAIPGGQWGTSIKVSVKVTPDVWTQWTHIAGVYDGQMLLLYINGQLVASTAASGRLQDSDRPISIGNHPSWNAFKGSIDEVRLYNVALNASQVSQLLSNP
jgi:serine/threonine protein kinase